MFVPLGSEGALWLDYFFHCVVFFKLVCIAIRDCTMPVDRLRLTPQRASNCTFTCFTISLETPYTEDMPRLLCIVPRLPSHVDCVGVGIWPVILASKTRCAEVVAVEANQRREQIGKRGQAQSFKLNSPRGLPPGGGGAKRGDASTYG